MGQDFIKTSDISVAHAIRNALEKLGIKQKFTGITDFCKFTQEELSSITKLELHDANFKDISILRYCTNLKELSIRSKNASYQSTNLLAEAEFDFISKQSLITDFSVISSLKNLEFLEIEFNDGLKSLDLTGLDKLVSLKLRYNQNLSEIKGLGDLPQLYELTLIKNGLKESFDLPNLFRHQLCNFELDFNLYPILIQKYPDMLNLIIEYQKNGGTYKWVENVSDIELNYLDSFRLDKMNKKADEIIREIIGSNFTDLEKISAIYAYIIQNVKYDHESLNAAKKGEHNSAWDAANKNLGELNSTILLRRQSSFNAIMESKSVCEGYTNMMQYLLQKVGIRAYTCACSSKKGEKIIGSDRTHSVIKVEYKGEWYYFDPTWDAGASTLKYFFKTKEEFSESHSLSLTERDVISPSKTITNEQLTHTLQKVVLLRDSGEIKKENEEIMIKKMSPDEYAKYKLPEIQIRLSSLRKQYEDLSYKIEDIMLKNHQQGNFSYYKAQLDSWIAQRDKINEQISSLMQDEKRYKDIIDQEKEREHQAIIHKIETMYNIIISPTNGYIYRNDLGIPQVLSKNKRQLLDERTKFFQLISQSVTNGEINSKTADIIRVAIMREYDKMISKAPEPLVRDDSIFDQKQEQVSIQHKPQEKSEDFTSDFRKKYKYDSMSDDEKRRSYKQTKEQLEKQRRELIRKKFQERAKAMGLNLEQIANLDNLFKEQEIIEQQNLEEIEEIEQDHGMTM